VFIEDVSDLHPTEFEDTTSQQPIIEAVLEKDEKLQLIKEDQAGLTIEEILEPPDSKDITENRIESDKILIHIAVERMLHIPDECVKECTNLQAQTDAKERTFVVHNESTEKDCNLSFDDLVIRESPVIHQSESMDNNDTTTEINMALCDVETSKDHKLQDNESETDNRNGLFFFIFLFASVFILILLNVLPLDFQESSCAPNIEGLSTSCALDGYIELSKI